MDGANRRVLLKEPRGFIRLLQIFFSSLAWSSTASFSTKTTLQIRCPETPEYLVDYNVSYPFDLRQVEVSAPRSCENDVAELPHSFPVDFSASAMLFVLVCIISLLYATGTALCYCFLTAKYERDPLAPMFDLGCTILIAVFWTLMTCTWALNVSDLKHYTHPNYLRDYLPICDRYDEESPAEALCETLNPGKWTPLTASIVSGFGCVLLWFSSGWFIFKETTLHKNKQAYQSTTAAGLNASNQYATQTTSSIEPQQAQM